MKAHDGCVRGFYVLSQSWYGRVNMAVSPDLIEEITIGMYHPEGGTTGEFAIRWAMLSGKPTPRLEAFDDAWHALTQFSDLLRWMASLDDENPSPQRVADALMALGVKDLTERVNPHTSPAEREYLSWGCV